MNPLSNIFAGAPQTQQAPAANSTPMMLPQGTTQMQAPANGISNIPIPPNNQLPPMAPITPPAPTTPAPIFTGIKSTQPAATVGKKLAPTPPANSLYSKYVNPQTGKVMSPTEYATYLASKIPQGSGQIPQYAGDAITQPNQTPDQLSTTANNLNNSRNDIATGATDPYKVGNQSGIAYSPAELSAIQKAYAGVYDPALNDVFNKLKTAQTAQTNATDLQNQKELDVFKTNEAIRQWRATTRTTPAATGADSAGAFTKTQLATGASKSGLSLDSFNSLDPDIKNFYIHTPSATDPTTGKSSTILKNFTDDIAAVAAGTKTAADVNAEISGAPLSPAVKTYFINQLPNVPAPQKQSWIESFWNGVKNMVTGN